MAHVKGVILDIEGTICPISFVKDVLFPYFLTALPPLLETSWSSPALQTYIANFPSDVSSSPAALLTHVRSLVAADVKAPYLKALQGYVWLSGYESGALRCPLFQDVLASIQRWSSEGRRVMIYSSGSVAAQKLLLQYTTEDFNGGDLREFISGWYDTVNAGMKQEKASYEKIVASEKESGGRIDAQEWCFFSDNVREIEAATEAGLQAVLTFRPGNAEVPEAEKKKYRCCDSFADVELA